MRHGAHEIEGNKLKPDIFALSAPGLMQPLLDASGHQTGLVFVPLKAGNAEGRTIIVTIVRNGLLAWLLANDNGVKVTDLLSAGVRDMLATADSMAWSYAARKQGRDAHDWREAQAFVDKVSAIASSAPGPYMVSLFP